MPNCRNCGSHVSRAFCRVYGLGGEVRACRACATDRELSRGAATGEVVSDFGKEKEGESLGGGGEVSWFSVAD